MLLALLKKELRQLLPWLLLVVALTVGGFAAGLLFEPPDELTWADKLPLFSGEATGWGLWLMVLALLCSYAGFPREHEEGTLQYLFSLPVSRVTIFLAKALAVGVLLSIDVVLSMLIHAAGHVLNPSSFVRGSFRWDWQLCSLGLSLALAWIWVGYTLLLAVFRRFGLLLLLMAFVVIELLAETRPALRVLDPTEILDVDFFGTRPLVPWSALLGHLFAALVAALVAGLLWVGPTDRLVSVLARATAKPVLKWGAGLAMAAIALASIEQWADDEAAAGAEFGEIAELASPEARLETRRYEFRFPEALRPRVEVLARSADELFERMARRLGAELGAGRVVVDLTRASRNFAGSASWDTIRMDLSAASDDQALRRVLAHESSHVLALRASDRRTGSHATSLRFFDEGLAEWLALAFVPGQAYVEARRFEAAILRSRKRLRLAELMDYTTFVRRYGEPALYGLGLVWVESLVTRCGPDLPRLLLRTLARPDTPAHVSGVALWQHLLQVLGCDLVQAEQDWEAALTRAIAGMSGEIALVPSIVGGAPKRDEYDGVVLASELEGTPMEGVAYFVNVRQRSESVAEVFSFSGSAAGTRVEFWVPEGYELNGTLEFQLAQSWERQGELVNVAEDWQSVRVR